MVAASLFYFHDLLLRPATTEQIREQGVYVLNLKSPYPDVELDILVHDRLDIETDGGDSCNGLVQLELVENGYVNANQNVWNRLIHRFQDHHCSSVLIHQIKKKIPPCVVKKMCLTNVLDPVSSPFSLSPFG